jgi:hypothetical protein
VKFASVIGGGLTLALLEVLVSSSSASSDAGGLLDAGAGIVRAFVSPATALIPDRRTTSSATSSSTTTTGGVETAGGAAPGLSGTVPVPAAPSGSVTVQNV